MGTGGRIKRLPASAGWPRTLRIRKTSAIKTLGTLSPKKEERKLKMKVILLNGVAESGKGMFVANIRNILEGQSNPHEH